VKKSVYVIRDFNLGVQTKEKGNKHDYLVLKLVAKTSVRGSRLV
jgi:hypothetical protein